MDFKHGVQDVSGFLTPVLVFQHHLAIKGKDLVFYPHNHHLRFLIKQHHQMDIAKLGRICEAKTM